MHTLFINGRAHGLTMFWVTLNHEMADSEGW
jgi:hypothetical protein